MGHLRIQKHKEARSLLLLVSKAPAVAYTKYEVQETLPTQAAQFCLSSTPEAKCLGEPVELLAPTELPGVQIRSSMAVKECWAKLLEGDRMTRVKTDHAWITKGVYVPLSSKGLLGFL